MVIVEEKLFLVYEDKTEAFKEIFLALNREEFLEKIKGTPYESDDYRDIELTHKDAFNFMERITEKIGELKKLRTQIAFSIEASSFRRQTND